MELKERGKGLQRKQALAAIGQGRLIAMWDNLFGMVGTPIAQILLTRQDISDVSTLRARFEPWKHLTKTILFDY